LDEVFGPVLTAMVTPFKENGAVDYVAFRTLARYLVEHGSDGLVVTGSTGEAPTLSDRERLLLYAAAVDEVGERASVIASTGTYDTRHSVALTEQADNLGVDGFLIVAPYYSRPPARGIVEHFKHIAARTDKPILAYNIPVRTGVKIEVETFAQLARIGVVGVKQAWDDLDEARQIADLGLHLYAGNDELVMPFLAVGGVGGICVHTHLVGPAVKDMIRRYKDGDIEGAEAISESLDPVLDAIGVVINPISTKAALNLVGHEVGGVRLPLVEATPGEVAQIRAALERGGILQPSRA
jgi:4-hydroxy-tetrahydrodipicolinate synthase